MNNDEAPQVTSSKQPRKSRAPKHRKVIVRLVPRPAGPVPKDGWYGGTMAALERLERDAMTQAAPATNSKPEQIPEHRPA